MHTLIIILSVGGIILAMVVLLLGINRYILGEDDTQAQAEKLRKETNSDPTPVSEHSLFSRFLTPAPKRHPKYKK